MKPSDQTFTVQNAAGAIGLTPARVRQICQRFEIGTLITPRMRLLSGTDVKSLMKIASTMKPGRPKKFL